MSKQPKQCSSCGGGCGKRCKYGTNPRGPIEYVIINGEAWVRKEQVTAVLRAHGIKVTT